MSINVINWSLSYQEILDNFRAEVSEQRKCIEDLRKENAKLRKLVQRMWPVFIGEKRATFADRLHVRAEIDELGIEVQKMSDLPGITQKLRDSMQRYDNFDGTSRVVLGEARFDNLCDAIDSVHAALESGTCDQLKAENAKLRELVRDMWRDGMCECDERGACAECEYGYFGRMRELGIEVD